MASRIGSSSCPKLPRHYIALPQPCRGSAQKALTVRATAQARSCSVEVRPSGVFIASTQTRTARSEGLVTCSFYAPKKYFCRIAKISVRRSGVGCRLIRQRKTWKLEGERGRDQRGSASTKRVIYGLSFAAAFMHARILMPMHTCRIVHTVMDWQCAGKQRSGVNSQRWQCCYLYRFLTGLV